MLIIDPQKLLEIKLCEKCRPLSKYILYHRKFERHELTFRAFNLALRRREGSTLEMPAHAFKLSTVLLLSAFILLLNCCMKFSVKSYC